MAAHDDLGSLVEQSAITLVGSHWCFVSPKSFTEACFSVPAVRALKHFSPNAKIAVLCPESQLSLWQYGLDEIEWVIDYEDGASASKIVTVLEAGSVRFDSAILWETGCAAKAVCKLDVGQRVGYAYGELEPLVTDSIAIDSQPGPIEHRVRHYLGLIDQLGADAFVRSSFQKPSLPVAPAQTKIAIAPFSVYGGSHQWPAERFLKVIELIEQRHSEVSWVLYGHEPKSSKQGMEVFGSLLGQDNFSLDNSADVDVFAALAQSSALLACDGEVAHMAAHVGLPATVIFGPNSPEWRRPLGKQSVVVREHVACSPCFKSKCPLDFRCQTEVSIEAVVESLELVMGQRGS